MTLSTWIGLAGMFCVIKNQYVTGRSFCSNDTGILRHVPSPIDLSLVVDLDFDLDLAADRAEASKLALFIVVVRRVELRVLVWQLHAGDQQVVLLVGCVRAKNQPVD